MLEGATFAPPLPNAPGDPAYVEWQNGKGVYTTNGAVLGIIKKSSPELADPDLFIFALPGKFYGYFPGYSAEGERTTNFLTWAILKAHTNNTAGYVQAALGQTRSTLRRSTSSTSTRGTTRQEDRCRGGGAGGRVRAADHRRRTAPSGRRRSPGRRWPTHGQILEFVKNNAWGHHASCSNPMGPARRSEGRRRQQLPRHRDAATCAWSTPRSSRASRASSSSRRST